jgi:hypothetical protein
MVSVTQCDLQSAEIKGPTVPVNRLSRTWKLAMASPGPFKHWPKKGIMGK